MSDIHSRIKHLREQKKLSFEAFAAKVGVSWQAAQQWEKPDGTAPKRARLELVAHVLETTVDYLLFGRTQPTQEHKASFVSEPTVAGYRAEKLHPDTQAVVKLMQATDDRGRTLALGAIKAALADHRPAVKNRVK